MVRVPALPLTCDDPISVPKDGQVSTDIVSLLQANKTGHLVHKLLTKLPSRDLKDVSVKEAVL